MNATRTIQLFDKTASVYSDETIRELHDTTEIQPPRFGLLRSRLDEMDNETRAEVRRYLTHAAIHLLSEQATEEDDHVRVQQFCHVLMGMFIQRFHQSTRLDHILRNISTERAQQPQLRKLAEDIDKVFVEFRDELIIHLVGDLKHPERSRLNIPITDELAAKISKRLKATSPR